MCILSQKVIGEMSTSIPRYGLDINREFLGFCKQNHKADNLHFMEADALHLVDWWKSKGFFDKYKKPLVTCVNNTLNIMPEHLRGGVIEQMLKLAGEDGIGSSIAHGGKLQAEKRQRRAVCLFHAQEAEKRPSVPRQSHRTRNKWQCD